KDEELDDMSVRGGCFVAAVDKPEIRCSADAVKLFADRGNGGLQPNPALLYVLAHELAHVLQKRAGEYAGRTVTLTVAQDQANALRRAQGPDLRYSMVSPLHPGHPSVGMPPVYSPRNLAAPIATSIMASLTSISSPHAGQRYRYSSGGGPNGSSRASCGSG